MIVTLNYIGDLLPKVGDVWVDAQQSKVDIKKAITNWILFQDGDRERAMQLNTFHESYNLVRLL